MWENGADYLGVLVDVCVCLLQKRTQQLEEVRATHTRHMSDLQVYLTKYNDLVRELNVIDDKVLNDKELKDSDKEKLMNGRIKTWGELDFLRTRISEMLRDEEFAPEYTKLSELSAEYELTRAENEEIKFSKENEKSRPYFRF